MTTKPTRPALRYFGGKWRLAPWIISHFPPHICYVEPFCGAASVFLRKTPAEFEVINDIDGDVVNFFQMLRDETDSLIHAILTTPYSRTEYNESWKDTSDPLERARRYYIHAWQGWGGSRGANPASYRSWRFQHSNTRGKSVVKDWNQVEHLQAIVWRLKQALIENDDALTIIDRYDQSHTLFYLDPPYLKETRSKRWRKTGYQCEIDADYHRRLLDKLLTLQGMAIISGYPSDFYDERLTNWRKVKTTARTTNSVNTATEIIWLSPSTMANSQLTLI